MSNSREENMNFGNDVRGRFKNFWNTLTISEMAAATILGWNPQSWEEGESNLNSLVTWENLSQNEKRAITILGYTIPQWDNEVQNERSKTLYQEQRREARNNWEKTDEPLKVNNFIENFEEKSIQEIEKIEQYNRMKANELINIQTQTENISIQENQIQYVNVDNETNEYNNYTEQTSFTGHLITNSDCD